MISRADYIARAEARLLALGHSVEVAAEGALTLADTSRGDPRTPELDADEYSVGWQAGYESQFETNEG